MDLLAPDGDVLWLHQDQGLGRQLFLRSEGWELWRY
jgi:hypothetical protein